VTEDIPKSKLEVPLYFFLPEDDFFLEENLSFPFLFNDPDPFKKELPLLLKFNFVEPPLLYP